MDVLPEALFVHICLDHSRVPGWLMTNTLSSSAHLGEENLVFEAHGDDIVKTTRDALQKTGSLTPER